MNLKKMMNKPELIIIHHSGNNNGFDIDNDYHTIKKWNFISSLGYGLGYTWYYDKNRGWIQARKEDEEGAHTLGGWNSKSIGVCIQGNYNNEDFILGRELENKIKDIRSRWGNLPVKTHRELWNTECPGKNLQKWIDGFRNNENQVNVLKQIIEKLKKIIKILKGRLK